VELSDIDLCLKLSEKGWTTIIDPAIHLIHEESATRGRATFRRLNVYQDQRAYFVNRWRHVLRNDPYFHPALSLFHWRSALG
jgi:GT2 family glycosyltransferase